MAGRISFRLRIFLILLATCWLLAAAFMTFQYFREREFKARLIDTRLQMHNARILQDLEAGETLPAIVRRIAPPVPGLRVTYIDSLGNVLYDSRRPALRSNHNGRPEVRAARAVGSGHAMERKSEGDSVSYFYSAMLGPRGVVVRSAAPYGHSLTEFLRVDSAILWIMGALTVVMSLIGLLVTRKISLSIRRLSRFAAKAEKGGAIYGDDAFPDDELGSIAANIVRLYVDRDEQHRRALRLEQDRSRIKKQLTNNINHELKTPVAAILLSLDMLRDHPSVSPAKKSELIARIRDNAERLSSLLRDVSVITRMDDAPEMITREPVDLSALVCSIVEEAQHGTAMRITVDMPRLTADANRPLMESVFRNLIDNAIAYSGASLLTITADSSGNFRVCDNGRGIPPEHLPHIFERFYRVDDGRTRAAGGTGLGLSIVRNAVALHGGSIRAFNAGGLCFEFNIPVTIP